METRVGKAVRVSQSLGGGMRLLGVPEPAVRVTQQPFEERSGGVAGDTWIIALPEAPTGEARRLDDGDGCAQVRQTTVEVTPEGDRCSLA